METGNNGSLVARAIAIAAVAHEHQVDKASRPYVLHQLRMMTRASTEVEQIVAVLHDLVEDCEGWTFDRLAVEGFGPDLLTALDCVTTRAGETYDDFIDRVLTNPVAVRVKIFDLEDNMTLTRLPELTEKDVARLEKYHRAWKRLVVSRE